MGRRERPRRPEGEVRPLGSGSYFVRWQTRQRDRRGRFKAKSETLYNTTEAKARKHLRDRLAEVRTGLFHAPAAKTCAAVFDEWLKQQAREGRRPASLNTYEGAINAYLKPHLGHLPLKELESVAVRDLYNALQDKGLATKTIRFARTVLNLILRDAVAWGYLKENPAEGIKAPKGAEGRAAHCMNPDEARAFVEAALLDPDDLVFVFALLTGLRPEEYLGLPRHNVEFVMEGDTERGLVRVRQVAVKLRGGGWVFHPPKTEKGVRDVPFPAWLYRELERFHALTDSRRLAFGSEWQDFGLVFPSRTGAPRRGSVLAEGRLKPLLKRAGLPSHFTLYSLRYSYATLQYLAGERDRVISDLMGHTRTDFTKSVYTKVLPLMRERASDSLERLLFGDVRAPFAQQTSDVPM